jgi:hypothetical protein
MRDDQFMATCDAAKVLECTPDNVRSLERRGKLSAMRTPSGRWICIRETTTSESMSRLLVHPYSAAMQSPPCYRLQTFLIV